MAMNPASRKFLQRGAATGERLGVMVGGALGAARGASRTSINNQGKKEERSTARRILGGVGGGLVGGFSGAILGGIAGSTVNSLRLKKTLPKSLARKLNKATNDVDKARIKKDFKQNYGLDKKAAMLEGFADELEKIAAAKTAGTLGAILGGAAGLKLSPGTMRGKVIGGLGGAAIGSLLEGTAKKTKQWVWDEPRAREHAELYGYMPAASQMDVRGTNFY